MNYETPVITDYGTLVQLTQASASGAFTDATFPAHTPVGDLTFS